MLKIDEAVRSVAGQSVQWIGREIDIPIGVETQNPSETGIDRILNVAAAFEQMSKACIVVDAGTAVTVDCCNDNGDFLGGAIAPGVSMMVDALAEKTAGIGRVSFSTPSGAVGDSTASAVSQGVYHRHSRIGPRSGGELRVAAWPVAGDHRHGRGCEAIVRGVGTDPRDRARI